MIYLIAGAPRVGKSVVASWLAKRLGIPYVGTDDLCDRVSTSLSEEEKASKFPLPPFSGDPIENIATPDERVAFQIVSAKSLEPEIDRLISKSIEEKASLVIEGIHLLPEYVSGLLAKYGSENIRALFIGSQDIDLVADGIVKNTHPNNWMKDSDPQVIRQVAEFVVAFSGYVKKEGEGLGLTYRERTENFEKDIEDACGALCARSEKKRFSLTLCIVAMTFIVLLMSALTTTFAILEEQYSIQHRNELQFIKKRWSDGASSAIEYGYHLTPFTVLNRVTLWLGFAISTLAIIGFSALYFLRGSGSIKRRFLMSFLIALCVIPLAYTYVFPWNIYRASMEHGYWQYDEYGVQMVLLPLYCLFVLIVSSVMNGLLCAREVWQKKEASIVTFQDPSL